ncbi:MAG: diaminopimelate decarboxylase [Deltaproteobacteria bacterium]|nr:diaminopimelate decarboxylase [Deltaproteobacteria bacterium]
MTKKSVPFSQEKLNAVIKDYPTPFHIYDEKKMRENARALIRAFSWNEGFREYFAVKAAPNPFLMKILAAEGFGADCSSLPELIIAEKCGVTGEDIMFTSNDTPAEEFIEAERLGAIINLDDISHIPFLEHCAGLPDIICCRYNPGPLKKGNLIIGHPEEAKYGFTREQLFEGYKILRDKGIRRFGIHTMVASNELDPLYFVETAGILFTLIAELSGELGIRFEFANIGGGLGIPYRPGQKPLDLEIISNGIRERYNAVIEKNGLSPLKLFMECGRYITGPYGYLISRVLHLKNTYKHFAGLDACMANLMRPALYGAYHHITVMGKENAPATTLYDVTGSLCENNDKFAIDRKLPELAEGDIVVIHDAGAHGHAMGFNYNGKLRSAELLLRENGDVEQIRRAETADDYFATLDWGKMANFKA